MRVLAIRGGFEAAVSNGGYILTSFWSRMEHRAFTGAWMIACWSGLGYCHEILRGYVLE